MSYAEYRRWINSSKRPDPKKAGTQLARKLSAERKLKEKKRDHHIILAPQLQILPIAIAKDTSDEFRSER